MRARSRAAAAVAVGMAIAVAGPPVPAAAASCLGRATTIVGTGGTDRIRGTPGPDVVAGLDGSDLIRGRGGDDRLCGGGGADVISGQGGDDRVTGSGGSDILEGGAGRDRLKAGGGFDFLDGGTGGDVMFGGGGNTDLLRGRGGNDRLRGGGGFDILIGDSGNDLMHGGPGRVDLATFVRNDRGVTVDLTGNRATGEGQDRIVAVEDVEGTRFNDVLIGSRAANFMVPLGGDDLVQAMDGFDQVLFLNSAAPITLDLAAGTASGEGTDQVLGFEGSYGSPFDDQMAGDDLSNFLFGFEGSDTVSGRGADDILDGDLGADEGDGGDGSDICANFENGEPPPNCESTRSPGGIRSSTEGIRALDGQGLDEVHELTS